MNAGLVGNRVDTSGYFYIVSKVFLYNGSDYINVTCDNIEGIFLLSEQIREQIRCISLMRENKIDVFCY